MYCAFQVVDYSDFYTDVSAVAADSGVSKVWISYVANYAIFNSIPEVNIAIQCSHKFEYNISLLSQ